MPTLDWLKKEFHYGYYSGDILAEQPDDLRRQEESRAGGSYAEVFQKAVIPSVDEDSTVLELGPGRGSWSLPLLGRLSRGALWTADFQDVSPWLRPQDHDGRLRCVQVADNSFAEFPDNGFDFIWSFGVLCHCNQTLILEILTNTLGKARPGARAVHQYADWDKLDAAGWPEEMAIPKAFRDAADDEMWWPRNRPSEMASLARQAGWKVMNPDLGLLRRDAMILLQRP